MKLFKKIFTGIVSTIICSVSVAGLAANANVIYVENGVSEGMRYEIWNDLEDFVGYTRGNIYKSVTPYESTGAFSYIYSTGYEGIDNAVSYGTFHINFNQYDFLTTEQYAELNDFLSQNYPEIELIYDFSDSANGADCYKMNYNAELMPEEKLEIAKDIRNNTGLMCAHYYLLSSDIIVIEETTTTTTTASATTTTTTTTAAVSSTTAKKGVDSPKTGDSGLAGVLLAGAGAVAMAFALRKRED